MSPKVSINSESLIIRPWDVIKPIWSESLIIVVRSIIGAPIKINIPIDKVSVIDSIKIRSISPNRSIILKILKIPSVVFRLTLQIVIEPLSLGILC